MDVDYFKKKSRFFNSSYMSDMCDFGITSEQFSNIPDICWDDLRSIF
jgi:hypothetical protein